MWVMEPVFTPKAPKPVGPYSQGVKAGNLVFVSGQLGIDPETGELAEGLRAQAERALLNLREVLLAAGGDLGNVVKTTVYITDMSQFGLFNEIYSRLFPEPHPARSVVEVSALPLGALVEVEAIAIL